MRDISGIFVADKPRGWTSFDVVAKVRGIYGVKKAGHSGTLDPMATGVLPVFIGKATKAISILPTKEKEYSGTFRLGIVTDTGDITGKVMSSHTVDCTPDEVTAIVPSFTGKIMQVPPMYSALKKDGQPLYKLARQGKTVDREPREVFIKDIEVLPLATGEEYSIKVTCSQGTYIRTLVEDMGQMLGCGATLTSLRRTRASGFLAEDAVTVDELVNRKSLGKETDLILPVDSAFLDLPDVCLDFDRALGLLNGVQQPVNRDDGLYRVYFKSKFLAVASVSENIMRSKKIFVERQELSFAENE